MPISGVKNHFGWGSKNIDDTIILDYFPELASLMLFDLIKKVIAHLRDRSRSNDSTLLAADCSFLHKSALLSIKYAKRSGTAGFFCALQQDYW